MRLRTGLKRDLPDSRDYIYKFKRCAWWLPGSVDLRSYCSPVEEQGEIGSCTGQALAGNIEFLDCLNDGIHIDVSRLFIYYNERMIEGTIEEDSGAYIRDGIKTLAKYGVCPESMHPYIIDRFRDKPSDECYK